MEAPSGSRPGTRDSERRTVVLSAVPDPHRRGSCTPQLAAPPHPTDGAAAGHHAASSWVGGCHRLKEDVVAMTTPAVPPPCTNDAASPSPSL